MKSINNRKGERMGNKYKSKLLQQTQTLEFKDPPNFKQTWENQDTEVCGKGNRLFSQFFFIAFLYLASVPPLPLLFQYGDMVTALATKAKYPSVIPFWFSPFFTFSGPLGLLSSCHFVPPTVSQEQSQPRTGCAQDIIPWNSLIHRNVLSLKFTSGLLGVVWRPIGPRSCKKHFVHSWKSWRRIWQTISKLQQQHK